MSLRAKLVIALGALLALGLLAFGIGTYARYSSAEYRRLDDRLRSSSIAAERELHELAGLEIGPPGGLDDSDSDDAHQPAHLVRQYGVHQHFR